MARCSMLRVLPVTGDVLPPPLGGLSPKARTHAAKSPWATSTQLKIRVYTPGQVVK
jgi:hypothetical protein